MSAALPAATYRGVFDYEAQPKEWLERCGLCERPLNTITRNEMDRYGFVVGVERCDCGLVFLNPRMTDAAYMDFYRSGAYRRLVSAFHGRNINAKTIQPEQRKYGFRLAWMLEPWKPKDATTLLDVGGSTGVVAGVVGLALSLKATVLDPSPAELAEAHASERIRGLIETADLGFRTWDVVTLCQTVDHLLDPLAALRRIRAHLAPHGVLWIDAVDYERTGTLKVDHLYNFTARTFRALTERAGFRVVQYSRDGDHIGFLCKAA